ncbi:non-hydrolyzing UDP-N-acetylglucosamine 2-epimerase [Halalkalirubrum salinum]|uniref:non-hydrolyzing UDP-N-acetylglucosamine 2-epimerase n=1 Tax=Halalkalirubrum salinum TaxID=2563889 RepID=UPI0010FB1EF3|nr:UDP-N-acetylglucosamine 2-epimerase (non-hydrolyzing) [Halalkalirubrum salinum]
MSEHIAIVLGTRPEIIKLAPVVRACEAGEIQYTLIHTGQHYSKSMDEVFFDQLELPAPNYNLAVGSAGHGRQTGQMLIELEEILETIQPSTVLVQGDTNSVLAGALAAGKLDVTVGHVEAGLRSFDRDMPEELNRVVADHVADRLYAPTDRSRQQLRDEGIPHDRITVTGNTIVDAVSQHRGIAAERSSICAELDITDDFFILTAHRAENVDDPDRFERLLEGVGRAAAAHETEVIYPIHPRSAKRLETFGLTVPDRIRTVEPLDYLDFLRLESAAALILTDSGGVQEEACILGVPCVTLRDSTERPETISVGANRLCPPDGGEIQEAVLEALFTDRSWDPPFGDGTAGRRIVEDVTGKQLTPIP